MPVIHDFVGVEFLCADDKRVEMMRDLACIMQLIMIIN